MNPLVVANWKMNPSSLAEAKDLFGAIEKGVSDINNTEVVICPPFPYVSEMQNIKRKIKIGSQNCFWEDNGAFTGEISPKMLKDLGIEYVIVGHSERRKYLQETDEMINKKIRAALYANLKPILCIGESAEEKEGGRTKDVILAQLRQDLDGISEALIIAYEPVWAVGTGMACVVSDAKEANLFLRDNTQNSILLYGGSVNGQNAKGYIADAGFQGLLVGGSSLYEEEFLKIIKSVDL